MEAKIAALTRIYRVLEHTLGDYTFACRKRCAACCTSNVTVTTLETYQIIKYLDKTGKGHLLARLSPASDRSRSTPALTINALARRCAENVGISEKEPTASQEPCPLLIDDTCPIYIARPLACRVMVSSSDCRKTGYASMAPFILAVNNVFMQFAEHIDLNGFTGNLADVLLYLSKRENRQTYETDGIAPSANGLIANHPLTVLMVPPEHRQAMAPVLKALNPGMEVIT